MTPRAGKIVSLLGAFAVTALVACGSPGLTPAGPAPGEVDVGYGTQPKEDVTGAVTSVSERELGDLRPSNVEELLRGRVAGLQVIPRPGGGYTYRIRGIGTMHGEEQEPLFVIDGTQVSPGGLDHALAGLTRDDIRQVDVLKDIASTSIYGLRGAGGVVLITTKRR